MLNLIYSINYQTVMMNTLNVDHINNHNYWMRKSIEMKVYIWKNIISVSR